MGQTNPEDFGNGGTIDGDLIVSGDLQVSGGGSLSFDEIVEGTSQVKVTNTSAFLVEKSDGTDVFIVDTTNSRVGVGVAPSHELTVNNQIGIKRDGTDAFGTLTFDSAGLKINQSTSGYSPLIILSNSSEIARFSADGDLGIGTTSTANKPISVKVNRNGTQELKFENDDSGEWYFTLQNDRITEDSVSHAINFDANDSGGTNTRYSKIENVIVDNTSGSEDGRLVFSTFVNGTSTETMHITNSSVGIGGMPSDDLHIINSENVYLQLESSNTGTTKESAIKYSNFSTGSNFWWAGLNQSDDYSLAYGTSFSGANTRLLLTETGLLGIGTASPDNPLSIRTDTADKGIVLFADGESSSNRIFNVMKDSSAGRLFLRDAGTPKIHFNAKSNEDHYINNGGSLGIGTDSPTALLSVQQASGSDTDFTNSNNPEAHHGILLNNNRFEAGSFTAITMNTANASSVNGVSIISQSASSGHAGKMIFARRALSGTTESMRLTSTGDLQLQERLTFSGTNDSIIASSITPHSNGFIYITGGSGGIVIGDDTPSSRIQILNDAEIRFEVNGSEKMRLDSTGLGIGTASPATNAKLHVVDGAGTAPTMHTGDMAVFQNNNDTSDNAGIVVVSGTGSGTSNGLSYLTFGDSAVKNQGGMIYYNGNDSLEIRTNATSAINIDSNQSVQFAQNVGIGMAPASSVSLDINISTDARGSFMDGISEIGSDFFGLNVTNAAGNALKPMGIRAEDIRLVTGNAERMRVTDSGILPGADDSIDLGSSSLRFDDIFSVNAVTTGSDKRLKDNIADSSLGLDFINALRPVKYKWKDYSYDVEKEKAVKAKKAVYETVVVQEAVEAKEAVMGTRQKTVSKEVEKTKTEIVEEGGKYVQKEITYTETVKEPQYEEVNLYDKDGKKIQRLVSKAIEAVEGVEHQEATYYTEDDELPEGKEVGDIKTEEIQAVKAVEAKDAVYENVLHAIPIMEEYEVESAVEAVEEITEERLVSEAIEAKDAVMETKEKTFVRTHFGLIAQEVEQVLKDSSLTNNDFAGLIYDEDSDRYGMRYNELIAPLIKAVQELSKKVTDLENK